MSNTILVGRVARELEIVNVGEKNVGKFSIAVDSRQKDAEGKAIPTFYNIESWDENYQKTLKEGLKKGESVLVKGQLVINEYTNSEGNKNKSFKVINPKVIFIGKNANAASENIFVAGRLSSDVELKELANGERLAKFSIAENYGKDNVNFYNVEVPNDKAEIMSKYLEKGALVKVDGELEITTFERSDGSKGTNFKIANANVGFLNKAASKETNAIVAESKGKSASKGAQK